MEGVEKILEACYKIARNFVDRSYITKEKVQRFFYDAVLQLVKRKSVRYGRFIDMVKAKLKQSTHSHGAKLYANKVCLYDIGYQIQAE